MKRNLVRGQNYSDLLTVQTKCKSDNAELFLKLFYIQSKEIWNKSQEKNKEKKESLKC